MTVSFISRCNLASTGTERQTAGVVPINADHSIRGERSTLL